MLAASPTLQLLIKYDCKALARSSALKAFTSRLGKELASALSVGVPRIEVVDVALSILDDTPQDQPLFLWVHVFDPHAPFEAPERHIEAAGSKVHFRPRLENTRLFLREELLGAYLGYELEIAYTDHELGRLLEAWDTRERGPNSVVAITSDHGEGMGEHVPS